jgi:lysyl-tRNA synthetase class 2
MSDSELAAQRRANYEDLLALGIRPYPNAFDATHRIGDIVATYGETAGEALEAEHVPVRAAGRILGLRTYIRQDSVSAEAFAMFKLLDFGDQVGVEGRLFRTRTNELTIWATALTFLAKSFLPLPEKWHGLQDIEIRYRQRYLDLIVNPDARRVFAVRARTLQAIRGFLDARGFLEVETPMMQPIAGGALARPFATHHNALDMKLYMRIAPELYLKRLVVGGMDRVYEINRNFRNEGISTQHNPEFTMLEFYQAYVDYQHLMRLTEEMFAEVALKTVGTTDLQFGEHAISFAAPFRRLSLRHAAAERASERLQRSVEAEMLRDAATARSVAISLGLEVPEGQGAGKTATEIFESLCEDDLIQPTFIYDFPTEVSPLSKQKADDPDTVERFELYAGGFELANAPGEMPKRTRWTRTTSALSSTGCRRQVGKVWASIAS